MKSRLVLEASSESRKKYLLDLLVTIVATLQEVRIKYILSLFPSQDPTF